MLIPGIVGFVLIVLCGLAVRQVAIDDDASWRRMVDLRIEIDRAKARIEASRKARRRKAIRYGWRRPA